MKKCTQIIRNYRTFYTSDLIHVTDLKNDPSRFDPPGVNFNAKLIGIDEVANARGDKMCQEAMYRLKVAVKQSGQHKQKIIINVSLDGIRIIDVRTHVSYFKKKQSFSTYTSYMFVIY